MKKAIALVTDSASNLHPGVAGELGIRVVEGSFAFDDEQVLDDPANVNAMYGRMCSQQNPPRTFGPTEAAWTEAFLSGLDEADAILCLVTPFDIASSFTTASAAMLAIQFERPDARIKIVNPGVGSAGLAALLMTLGQFVRDGATLDESLSAIEELEPHCDSVFLPGSLTWLEHSGRLALIEDRIGRLDDGVAVLRVGTRLTGLTKAADTETGLHEAVMRAVVRAGEATPLNVTIAHAVAPDRAAEAANMLRKSHAVRELCITELAATIGAQLGPATVGIGVAPAIPGAG